MSGAITINMKEDQIKDIQVDFTFIERLIMLCRFWSPIIMRTTGKTVWIQTEKKKEMWQ